MSREQQQRLLAAFCELRRMTSCEHYHHAKRDQHEAGAPCPVAARYDALIAEHLSRKPWLQIEIHEGERIVECPECDGSGCKDCADTGNVREVIRWLHNPPQFATPASAAERSAFYDRVATVEASDGSDDTYNNWLKPNAASQPDANGG